MMGAKDYVDISELAKMRGHYVADASAGQRYVIWRHEAPIAALVSASELNRLGKTTSKITLTYFRAEIFRLVDMVAGAAVRGNCESSASGGSSGGHRPDGLGAVGVPDLGSAI